MLIIVMVTITVRGAGLGNSPIHFQAKGGECYIFSDNLLSLKFYYFYKLTSNYKIETKHQMFCRIFFTVLRLT